MIENHRMDKLLKEVLMVDELSIVETDKVKRIENKAKTDFPDYDDSRARGFVLHSLEFHILSFILGIPIS
ncbi:hypothetical protein Tco_0921639 [Tanacetum coccineum]